MIPAWKIYYGDRSTYSNLDGDIEQAPRDNVQRVAYYDTDGQRHQCHDKDYYYQDGERWYGVDLIGLMQYLYEPGFKVVFFGRTIPNATFGEIANFADHDLPLQRAAVTK